jgi:hypothetical protein
MIWEVASLLAVGTLCAVTGWAAVYLAAKFQNRRPEMNPARLWSSTVAKPSQRTRSSGAYKSRTGIIVELSHKRQTKCNLRQS